MFPNRKHHLERVPEILEPFTTGNAKLHRHRGIPRSAVPFIPNEAQLRDIQDNLPDSRSLSSTSTDYAARAGNHNVFSHNSDMDGLLRSNLDHTENPVNEHVPRTRNDNNMSIAGAVTAAAAVHRVVGRAGARLVTQDHVESSESDRSSLLSVISDGQISVTPSLNAAKSPRSQHDVPELHRNSLEQDPSAKSQTSLSSSTGSSQTSGSSSTLTTSSDNEPMTFIECLEPDIRQSLHDGEEFDYLGLYAHPMFDVDEEKIRENLKTQKDILGKIREQPWRLRRKLKLYRIAHAYVERYEGRYLKGKANVANVTKFIKTARRVINNALANMRPWEERIKTVENRFGSAGASYFIFLRWMIGMNLMIAASVTCAVMLPQILFGPDQGTTFRNTISSNEGKTALDFATLYRYAGYIFYTPVYYGYYSDEPQFKIGYRLPLAYFCTAMAILIYSFWVILAKMATNVRLSANTSDGDQHPFSAGVFCSWDYMIANRDTADNKTAAITRQFKELLLEEEHKGRQENKWLRLFLRIFAWIITIGLLTASVFILLQVMGYKRSLKPEIPKTFWQTNAVSLTLKAQNIIFPELFERLEYLEEYHPLNGLRLHLTRITLLQLLVNWALIDNWVTEGEEMYHESTEFNKDDLSWIWNSSVPRPVNWETQTSRPEEHHGGGHGSADSSHSAAASDHGAPAGAHGSPSSGHAAPTGHGTPVASHANPSHREHGQQSDNSGQYDAAVSTEHHDGSVSHEENTSESSGMEPEVSPEDVHVAKPVEPNFALAEENPVDGSWNVEDETEDHLEGTTSSSESEHKPDVSLGDELPVGETEGQENVSENLTNSSGTEHNKEPEGSSIAPYEYDYDIPRIIAGQGFHPDDVTTPDVRVLINGTWLWPTRSLPPRPTTTPTTTRPVPLRR